MNRPRRITNYRLAVVRIYFRVFGRRCIRCSRPVTERDAVLWLWDTDFLLTHRKCKP